MANLMSNDHAGPGEVGFRALERLAEVVPERAFAMLLGRDAERRAALGRGRARRAHARQQGVDHRGEEGLGLAGHWATSAHSVTSKWPAAITATTRCSGPVIPGRTRRLAAARPALDERDRAQGRARRSTWGTLPLTRRGSSRRSRDEAGTEARLGHLGDVAVAPSSSSRSTGRRGEVDAAKGGDAKERRRDLVVRLLARRAKDAVAGVRHATHLWNSADLAPTRRRRGLVTGVVVEVSTCPYGGKR